MLNVPNQNQTRFSCVTAQLPSIRLTGKSGTGWVRCLGCGYRLWLAAKSRAPSTKLEVTCETFTQAIRYTDMSVCSVTEAMRNIRSPSLMKLHRNREAWTSTMQQRWQLAP